jgi:uncharacterized protein YlaI
MLTEVIKYYMECDICGFESNIVWYDLKTAISFLTDNNWNFKTIKNKTILTCPYCKNKIAIEKEPYAKNEIINLIPWQAAVNLIGDNLFESVTLLSKNTNSYLKHLNPISVATLIEEEYKQIDKIKLIKRIDDRIFLKKFPNETNWSVISLVNNRQLTLPEMLFNQIF